MKKDNIAIIGLGYWGTIVTNTLISLAIFKTIFICDNDRKKVNDEMASALGVENHKKLFYLSKDIYKTKDIDGLRLKLS